ncbi:cytoplasmic tRNA 2-thiolation protein 2-like [Arctopsyche grandis]|uniref:cytoplasmic tRNA 2-thiolation protein 2-like n=1 Tax=Arctopsyche grandis TaxID=121162 RepID=UPI00406DA2EA
MCTVNDDDYDGDKFMEQELSSLNLGNENCKKCKLTIATVTLRKKDFYCDDCFTVGVTHKFRATLGKSRLVKPGDKVLIAFSGKIDSSTLLYLVKNGIEDSTHKKLQFQALVLHIDESSLRHSEDAKNIEIMSQVKSQIQQYDLMFYSVRLSEVMKDDALNLNISDVPTKDEELDLKFKNLITSTKNCTAKLNLLKKLKQNLLLNCAKRLDCSYVLLAETATKLAANLLANVAIGGGSHMSSDIGFSDARDDRVKVLRPLKDLTTEDIALFTKIKNISEVQPTIRDDNPYASIQSLTKQFVNNLQNNFPATIPTVLRTGDKIDNSSNVVQDDDFQCVLCQSALDTQVIPCSAIEATIFSRETSNNVVVCIKDQAVAAEEKSCSNCSCKSSANEVRREDVDAFTCYSCQLIIKDIINVDLLPPILLKSIKKKKRLQNVKNSIQDFLL